MNKQKKHKGFTLIEAVFSTLVASVVIGFVYSFFSQSTRGISHSETANKSSREIQLLSNAVRQDMYDLKPFYRAGNASIELWGRDSSFPLLKKYYSPSVYIDGLSGGSLKKGLKDTQKTHKVDATINGIRAFKVETAYDSWFQKKPVLYGSNVSGLQDALVHIERKIKKPISATVSEYYIYKGTSRFVYRHYLKDNKNEPLNYVEYLQDPPSPELSPILLKTYGKDKKGKGIITGFQIFSNFEYSYYPDEDGNDILEFKRFFVSVHIGTSNGRSTSLSTDKAYNISFNVMNPHLNNQVRYKGTF
ncbi:MAG: hypothetical protein COB02_10085 [Candidatus Cloacimonadota bacterium]|nr:MAG: hypothetical protein COB02_10085 [Candidatus Cloacimonadota bacterium]